MLEGKLHLLLKADNFRILSGCQAAEVICANRTYIFDIRRNKMRLSPPKQITWFVALALAVLALLGFTGTLAALSTYAFWLALIAAALMLLATVVRGL
ncbi:MAG: hypothetical protein A2029_02760 [Chloroflexi bacterium RBG_19FT_COMBO_47_9]|nr:MAG: hypothetical protein A2029_02760 [Chloroflexi bacterium RBG_19FT_COMBO_47_9]